MSSFTTGQIIVPANSGVLLSNFTAAQLFSAEAVDSTIVRTRGEVLFAGDQLTVNEFPVGALGIKLQNERARVAGVASVPLPLSDPDQDWFVWQGLVAQVTGSSGAQTAVVYKIDSKAMRKIKGQDSLITVIENASALHGAAVTFALHFLIKVG